MAATALGPSASAIEPLLTVSASIASLKVTLTVASPGRRSALAGGVDSTVGALRVGRDARVEDGVDPVVGAVPAVGREAARGAVAVDAVAAVGHGRRVQRRAVERAAVEGAEVEREAAGAGVVGRDVDRAGRDGDGRAEIRLLPTGGRGRELDGRQQRARGRPEMAFARPDVAGLTVEAQRRDEAVDVGLQAHTHLERGILHRITDRRLSVVEERRPLGLRGRGDEQQRQDHAQQRRKARFWSQNVSVETIRRYRRCGSVRSSVRPQ